MSKNTRYLGLDVHAETITAAIAEVVAPSLIPKKSGERIKTDRRDAEKLAQCYQAGTLTAVWVPDGAHEALRDLVRARGAAKDDESRAKHRLIKYLLHYALRDPNNCRAWTHPWWRWLQALKLEHEAQRETLLAHIAEVLHQGERVSRLDKAIERAIESVSPEKKAVINALQALRGVAQVDSRYHRDRSGYVSEIPQSDGADGLHGTGAVRVLERRQGIQRAHHTNRQRASSTCAW